MKSSSYVVSLYSEQEQITYDLPKISVLKDIAIATNLDDNSRLIKQLKLNNIKYYKVDTANIIESFKNISEPYVLFVMDKDAVILKDLDDKFIEKFDERAYEYVFSSISNLPTDINLLNIWKSPILKGFNKYINIYLSFGYTDEISKIFNEILKTKIILSDRINCSDTKNLYFNSINCKFIDKVDLEESLLSTLSDDINSNILIWRGKDNE